jgi:hypothetical protein
MNQIFNNYNFNSIAFVNALNPRDRIVAACAMAWEALGAFTTRLFTHFFPAPPALAHHEIEQRFPLKISDDKNLKKTD